MPKPDPSTIEALKRLLDAKTHRAKCVTLGLPIYWHGTIGRILYGQNVSAMKENEVRQRLGLPPITPPLIPTHPCPSCAARGIIRSHGDKLDCHDKPVVAVALLAPGEVVKPAPTPKRKRLKVRRPYMGHELSVAMNDHGITDAMVRELVKAELSRR